MIKVEIALLIITIIVIIIVPAAGPPTLRMSGIALFIL